MRIIAVFHYFLPIFLLPTTSTLTLVVAAAAVAEVEHHHHPKSIYDYVSHNFEFDSTYNASIDNDAWKSMCEMIEERGFDCEIHFVTTEDGYILQVFRIPPSPRQAPAPSVLLQHGLECDSFQWLYNEPNQAITLAKAGYDVWMGNNRGNHFSTNHTKLDPWDGWWKPKDQAQFWDVDFEDMGLYDIPAMADWITQVTGNKQISYFGHSQGTTQFFIGATLNPDYYRNKFNFMGAIAPIANVRNQQSIPFALLAPQWDILQTTLVDVLGLYDWIQPQDWEKVFLDTVCTMPPGQYLCELVVELIADSNIEVDNFNRRKTLLTHLPAGASYKSYVHYAQMIDSGKFQRFDYGSKQANQKRYGHGYSTPPEYPLHQIPTTIPMALFAGRYDVLGDPADVQWLKDQLGDERVVFFKQYALGHLSFAIAKDMSYWTVDAMNLLKKYATVGGSSASLRTQ